MNQQYGQDIEKIAQEKIKAWEKQKKLNEESLDSMEYLHKKEGGGRERDKHMLHMRKKVSLEGFKRRAL